MSTIFKCKDGNEHDFDSNEKSEYCAKGCGEKWAIYAIKKLGADLKEKDAAVEQLKAEIICRDLKITIQHDLIQQLKSKLEIAKKGLEFYGDRESYVEDQEFHTIDSLNNDDEFLEKYQARVGGKTARQALKEIEG